MLGHLPTTFRQAPSKQGFRLSHREGAEMLHAMQVPLCALDSSKCSHEFDSARAEIRTHVCAQHVAQLTQTIRTYTL